MLHRIASQQRRRRAVCASALALVITTVITSTAQAQSEPPPTPEPGEWTVRVVKPDRDRAAGEPAAGERTTPRAGAPLLDPVTAREREALRRRIAPLTVVVRRSGSQPKGMWAPGGGVYEVHGWWARSGRVVTASIAVEGWPRTKRDRIEVETPDGRRFEAAVGVSDASVGLAVLDVAGLGEPPHEAPAGGADLTVSPGRPLYTADASGLLHRLVVGRRAPAQFAYYWQLTGRPTVGTPLFDADGRVLTLIGRDGPEAAVGLALPAKALRSLLERVDWTL